MLRRDDSRRIRTAGVGAVDVCVCGILKEKRLRGGEASVVSEAAGVAGFIEKSVLLGKK